MRCDALSAYGVLAHRAGSRVALTSDCTIRCSNSAGLMEGVDTSAFCISARDTNCQVTQSGGSLTLQASGYGGRAGCAEVSAGGCVRGAPCKTRRQLPRPVA